MREEAETPEAKNDRRRQLRGGIKKDHEPPKQFPNSIGAIFRAVFRRWQIREEPGRAPQTSSEFVNDSNFGARYEDFFRRYPGARSKNTHGLVKDHPEPKHNPKRLGDMLESLGTHKTGLDYPKLRTLADFLELPDAVILMQAKMISIERRATSDAERLAAHSELLRGLEHVVADLRRQASGEGSVFSVVDGIDQSSGAEDAKPVWVANIASLERLVTAFKIGQLTTLRDLEQRD